MEDIMRKEEFLQQLEQLLSGISEEERKEAMAFYRSYFEDAGAENEASILEELESPQKVAQSILKDLGMVVVYDGTNADGKSAGCSENSSENSGKGAQSRSGGNNSYAGSESKSGENGYAGNTGNGSYGNGGYGNGSYGNGGYGNGSYGNGNYAGERKNQSVNGTENSYGYGSYAGNSGANSGQNRQIGIIVVAVAAILLSPIWLGLLGGAFDVVVGLVGAVFGIIVAAVAVMGSLLIAGVAVITAGFSAIFSGYVAGGIGVIGVGMLLLSLGMLAVIATVWAIGSFLPWAYQGIRGWWSQVWSKRKGKKIL